MNRFWGENGQRFKEPEKALIFEMLDQLQNQKR